MASLLCDLGVAARVIRKGLILLVQEANGAHKGKWGLPKGRVDQGESPEAAALRELNEETGYGGQVMGLAGVRTALHKDRPAVFLCYDVHVEGEVKGHVNEEISSIKWFTLSEVALVDWVSETMHQLAVDGLTGRSLMPNLAGLTPRSNPYAVYRTSKTEWLRRGETS
jgi:8-oxo-dGTP diphosphatase|tara:strand:- start:140 stop:643 length:504 start_codon:yes stop_codon:yes gene_type:complete